MAELTCSQCGRYKHDLSKKMCEECRRKRRERAIRLEQKRREQGLCVKCAEPMDRGGARCKTCLREQRAKKNPEILKKCIECGDDVENPNKQKRCKCCLNSIQYADQLKYRYIISKCGNKCECCGEENKEFLRLIKKNEADLTFNEDEELSFNYYNGGDLVCYPGLEISTLEDGIADKYIVRCLNCALTSHIFGYCPHKKPNNILREKISSKMVLNLIKEPEMGLDIIQAILKEGLV